jgi:cryptochrome
MLASSTKEESKSTTAVVSMHWFRKGLRLHDNPGLLHALSLAKDGSDGDGGGRIYPVYVVDPNSYQLMKCSVNRARFLLECVRDLDGSLRERGSRLYVAVGDPVEVLPALWDEWGVTHVTHEADETGEPYAACRDEAVRNAALEAGVEVMEFRSETLRPLGNVTGGYVANVGGMVRNAPSTMSSFQQLLSRIDRGNIPSPSDAPNEIDFHGGCDADYDDKYLPLENPWDIPWPRGFDRNEIGPVWNREDCMDASMLPIAKGGETIALRRLQLTVTARPDW